VFIKGTMDVTDLDHRERSSLVSADHVWSDSHKRNPSDEPE
jgi:hypothetical protein